MSYWEEKNDEEEHDAFEQSCNDVARKVSGKGATNILCCIDGSDSADVAFRSALNLRRKFDLIEVFHAYKGKRIILFTPVVYSSISIKFCYFTVRYP